jgi:hypothetical protein
MGNLISAVADDMKFYVRLCQKYNEEVRYTKDVYGNDLPDCYGSHAKRLEAKNNTIKECRRKKYENSV